MDTFILNCGLDNRCACFSESSLVELRSWLVLVSYSKLILPINLTLTTALRGRPRSQIGRAEKDRLCSAQNVNLEACCFIIERMLDVCEVKQQQQQQHMLHLSLFNLASSNLEISTSASLCPRVVLEGLGWFFSQSMSNYPIGQLLYLVVWNTEHKQVLET